MSYHMCLWLFLVRARTYLNVLSDKAMLGHSVQALLCKENVVTVPSTRCLYDNIRECCQTLFKSKWVKDSAELFAACGL